MHRVDWSHIFKQTAPFMSHTERMIVLQVAGSDGISPVMLLAASIFERHEKANDFRRKIEEISGRLMKSFFNRNDWDNTKENLATYSIWVFVGKDALKLDQFLSILQEVKSEVAKGTSKEPESKSTSTMGQNIRRGLSDGSERTILRFPYPADECWEIGATHHSNERCTTENCPKSSIDLSPSLYHAYGYGFDYFGSEGKVVAAHGGEVFRISPCKLMVRAPDLWTYYSHIRLVANNGDRVRPGDLLGYIELDRASSNCNCEVA